MSKLALVPGLAFHVEVTSKTSPNLISQVRLSTKYEFTMAEEYFIYPVKEFVKSMRQ